VPPIFAAVNECDIGVENLWRQGDSGGRHNFAKFGQYILEDMFNSWKHAAALLFADEEWWYCDKRDKDWDVFKPCLAGYNQQCKDLFQTVLLILEELMSGWRPKTSQYGGFPSLSFKTQKPISLGTLLRNGCECLAGSLVYQDINMSPELQKEKQTQQHTLFIKTLLPGKSEIQAHVAEVLRQVEGAGVEPGGWTGGNAWFGSVTSCVHLIRDLGVHSTFIVKNNSTFFPMHALHAVLEARHGRKPAGHWVTMTTTIVGVKLIALAYAWSKNGVSYFISTCGSTDPSEYKYEAKYEDDWGNTSIRLLDRPKIADFLYQYLPLTDEHNNYVRIYWDWIVVGHQKIVCFGCLLQ
jgi:hypothetical protein